MYISTISVYHTNSMSFGLEVFEILSLKVQILHSFMFMVSILELV